MILPNFTIDEFITGQKFQELCDIDCEVLERQKKPFVVPDFLDNRPIIKVFCQTHFLNKYLPEIEKATDRQFVIVSHNSDGSICKDNPRDFDFQWRGNLPNVRHWFCQNVDVLDDQITPIPIAMENTYVYPQKKKKERLFALMQNTPSPRRDRFVYLCHNVWTNPNDRIEPYILFKNNPLFTVKVGYNSGDFDSYINDLAEHLYTLCPDGNGIDTIRMWEALYLGRIPIVKRHVFTEYFEKYLPIIIFDNYKDINLNSIACKWLCGASDLFNGDNYNINMLTMSYWRNKINEYCS